MGNESLHDYTHDKGVEEEDSAHGFVELLIDVCTCEPLIL